MADEEEVDVEICEFTLKLLQRRKVNSKGIGCFLCSMIVDDFAKHGKLTGYPVDAMGKGTFPVMSKVKHVQLERASQDTDKIVVPPAKPYPPTIKVPEQPTKQRVTAKTKKAAAMPPTAQMFPEEGEQA